MTSTPQLIPYYTSVMSATGGLAVLKLSNSTTSPYLTLQYTSAMIAIGPLVASMLWTSTSTRWPMSLNATSVISHLAVGSLLSSTSTPPPQFQNAIIPLEVGSL